MRLIFIAVILLNNIFIYGQNSKKKNTPRSVVLKIDTTFSFIEKLKFEIGSMYKSRMLNYKLLKTTTDSTKLNLIITRILELDSIIEVNLEKIVILELEILNISHSSKETNRKLIEILSSKFGIKYLVKIDSIFNKLPIGLKKSTEGINYKNIATILKQNLVGAIANDFSINDLNDSILILSSYRKNKFVLIDFWATWCKPCMDDLSFLKETYNQYNKLGLEIISISRDYSKQEWRKIIFKEKIQIWKHVLSSNDGRNSNSNITFKFFVSAIPVKILIDKEGKIIGRWLGGGPENQIEIKNKLDILFK